MLTQFRNTLVNRIWRQLFKEMNFQKNKLMKPLQAILAFVLVSSLFSCRFRTAPELPGTSEAVKAGQITLGGVLAEKLNGFISTDTTGAVQQPIAIEGILALQEKVSTLPKESEPELSDSILTEWKAMQKEIELNFEKLSDIDLQKWVELNDSLLKYSGQVCFADELEKVFYNTQYPDVLTEKALKSVCYTHRYDRIYLNVYGNSTLNFEHTTGGKVRLIQDTDYPYDGTIRLKVEMEDTRYMDLYIRIPEWAEYSSVTVRGVRYPVYPGQYTEVAKKWKNGDEAEIVLGLKPEVLRNELKQFAFSYGALFLSYPVDTTLMASKHPDDPVQDLNLVSPAGKMTTFTYSGIPDHTLVLQPFYAESDSVNSARTAWLH